MIFLQSSKSECILQVYCYKAEQKLGRDLLFWTPSYEARRDDHPTFTYIDQLSYDTEFLLNETSDFDAEA